MTGATYVCQLGCMSDCRHGLPCMVYGNNHPPTHLAFTDDGLMHEWRGYKGRGKCIVTDTPGDTA